MLEVSEAAADLHRARPARPRDLSQPGQHDSPCPTGLAALYVASIFAASLPAIRITPALSTFLRLSFGCFDIDSSRARTAFCAYGLILSWQAGSTGEQSD